MDERVEEAVKIKQQAMLKERKKLLAAEEVRALCESARPAGLSLCTPGRAGG